MATDRSDGARRQILIAALSAELERQALEGASRVDVEAMADAVEAALEPAPPVAEGKRPADLNATNDD